MDKKPVILRYFEVAEKMARFECQYGTGSYDTWVQMLLYWNHYAGEVHGKRSA